MHWQAMHVLKQTACTHALPLQGKLASTHEPTRCLSYQNGLETQVSQALDHLKAAVRLNPSEAKYRHSLGKAYEAAEQWQAALSHYQFAVDKDPFTTIYQMSMVKPLTRLRRLTRVVEVCPCCCHPTHSTACAALIMIMTASTLTRLCKRWSAHIVQWPSAMSP